MPNFSNFGKHLANSANILREELLRLLLTCSPASVSRSIGDPHFAARDVLLDQNALVVLECVLEATHDVVLGLHERHPERVVLARGLHDERDRPPRQQFSLQCLEILGKLVSARSTNNASRSTTTDAQTHVVDGNRHSIHLKSSQRSVSSLSGSWSSRPFHFSTGVAIMKKQDF